MITYNSVLDILGRAGLVNEMLRLLSSMKEDCDVSLNIITYNTVLNGMRKACRFETVWVGQITERSSSLGFSMR